MGCSIKEVGDHMDEMVDLQVEVDIKENKAKKEV